MNPSPAMKHVRPNSEEQAYAYAKACGIIGKSFVGKRISALRNLHNLADFDRLVFPETQQRLPGRELLIDLEHRILQRAAKQMLSVINSFQNPPELLVRLLRSCEYADLKNCLHHIASGKPAPEMICDIGRFRTVQFNAYPDIAAMIDGTEFTFILEPDINALTDAEYDFTRLETKLDLRYYTLLVQSMSSLAISDRLLAEQILAEEISLRNCVWALRLRTYFHMTAKETAQYLMDMKMNQSDLSLEARHMMDFQLDSRSDWEGWRWEKLLNPEKPGEEWIASPRFFQNAASQYIYQLALRYFHRMPFSISAIFCFIKLKQFEEDVLTSTIEGLGIGMAGAEVLEMFEAMA